MTVILIGDDIAILPLTSLAAIWFPAMNHKARNLTTKRLCNIVVSTV
jgi:hypothetical protein